MTNIRDHVYSYLTFNCLWSYWCFTDILKQIKARVHIVQLSFWVLEEKPHDSMQLRREEEKENIHNVFSLSTLPFSASAWSTLEFNNIYSVLKTDTKVISVFLSFLIFYISGDELCITKGIAHHLSPTLARKQRTSLLWSFMHLEWELQQISTVICYIHKKNVFLRPVLVTSSTFSHGYSHNKHPGSYPQPWALHLKHF